MADGAFELDGAAMRSSLDFSLCEQGESVRRSRSSIVNITSGNGLPRPFRENCSRLITLGCDEDKNSQFFILHSHSPQKIHFDRNSLSCQMNSMNLSSNISTLLWCFYRTLNASRRNRVSVDTRMSLACRYVISFIENIFLCGNFI